MKKEVMTVEQAWQKAMPVVDVQALALEQADAESLLIEVLKLDCLDTQEDFDEIKALATDWAGKLDRWVKLRQSVVGSAKKVITGVEGRFRPGAKAYEQGIEHMRGLLNRFETAKRAREREAEQALMAAASKGEDVTESLNAIAVDQVSTPARESWIWTLVDMASVPRKYVCLDSSALKIYLKQCTESGSTPEIPGLLFSKQASVTLRRN